MGVVPIQSIYNLTMENTNTDLEAEFEEALRATYQAASQRGYVAAYFLQMLEEHGGVETAKRLLATATPQTGLFGLYNLGILNESMEAVIYDNPRFHALFTQNEVSEARKRLEELGYFEKGK